MFGTEFTGTEFTGTKFTDTVFFGHPAVDTRFIFKPVMCDEITKIVTSFKSSSPGIDDLPMQLLCCNKQTLQIRKSL